MTTAALDVVGIGNAIVDVLAQIDDAFLTANEVSKGTMTLIDQPTATALYEKMPPAVEVSGGSAANTIAGIASLGGKAGFIGKVADDQLGSVFAHDIRALGIQYDTAADTGDKPTARCLVLITPDAERSMCTFLGASQDLSTDDLDGELIKSAQVTYLEGYLFDPPAARKAFYEAATIAHGADRLISLSLSDPFCCDRYRAEFRHLVSEEVDILFANEEEIKSLYEVDDFDAALQIVREKCSYAALTRSSKGSVIVSGDEVHVIDAAPVEKVEDTTGAGDLYAAGFLAGFTRGLPLATCGQLASLSAAEVISHVGARPETPLKELPAVSALFAD